MPINKGSIPDLICDSIRLELFKLFSYSLFLCLLSLSLPHFSFPTNFHSSFIGAVLPQTKGVGV